MMWLNVKRIFRSGFVNFFRNGFVSLSAILIMTITLSVFSMIIFTSTLLNKSLDEIKKKVDVNVYFLPNANEDRVLSVQKELQSLPEVEYVEYISKGQALENFQFRHKTDEGILQALDELEENPLGAILNVKTKETSQYESVSVFLEQNYPTGASENSFDRKTQKLYSDVEQPHKNMAFRSDLPFFTIILRDFDQKRTHTTLLSKDWNLEVGDIVEWESGSTHHGYATVISVNESALPDLVSVELRERK